MIFHKEWWYSFHLTKKDTTIYLETIFVKNKKEIQLREDLSFVNKEKMYFCFSKLDSLILSITLVVRNIN